LLDERTRETTNAADWVDLSLPYAIQALAQKRPIVDNPARF